MNTIVSFKVIIAIPVSGKGTFVYSKADILSGNKTIFKEIYNVFVRL